MKIIFLSIHLFSVGVSAMLIPLLLLNTFKRSRARLFSLGAGFAVAATGIALAILTGSPLTNLCMQAGSLYALMFVSYRYGVRRNTQLKSTES